MNQLELAANIFRDFISDGKVPVTPEGDFDTPEKIEMNVKAHATASHALAKDFFAQAPETLAAEAKAKRKVVAKRPSSSTEE